MPDFSPKKTMGSAAHLPATVKGSLVLDSVQVITHHRGIVRPTFCRRTEIVVVFQEPDPFAGKVPPRHADQLRAKSRDDDPKAVLFVRQNIEEAIAPLFFASRKGHSTDRRSQTTTTN